MNSKRSPRKQATPAALPVPRVRAIRCDDMPDTTEAVETKMRPRRNRKPKFVF